MRAEKHHKQSNSAVQHGHNPPKWSKMWRKWLMHMNSAVHHELYIMDIMRVLQRTMGMARGRMGTPPGGHRGFGGPTHPYFTFKLSIPQPYGEQGFWRHGSKQANMRRNTGYDRLSAILGLQ